MANNKEAYYYSLVLRALNDLEQANTLQNNGIPCSGNDNITKNSDNHVMPKIPENMSLLFAQRDNGCSGIPTRRGRPHILDFFRRKRTELCDATRRSKRSRRSGCRRPRKKSCKRRKSKPRRNKCRPRRRPSACRRRRKSSRRKRKPPCCKHIIEIRIGKAQSHTNNTTPNNQSESSCNNTAFFSL